MNVPTDPRPAASEARPGALDAVLTGSVELEAGLLIASKYRLLRTAGTGGMAAIWAAKNEATGAEVVVKILRPDHADSPDAIVRFRREAHAAARLSHRGIVRIFDLLEFQDGSGSLAIVMELLKGQTLAAFIDDRGALPLEQALDIMMPILSALSHAHGMGIVHRDLKPDNVFLSMDPDGHVTPKVLDFGISKRMSPDAPSITTDGALLGTPAYMSPEQTRGAVDVDARSDVFTLGILLYEMLAGKNPFTQASYHSVVAAILERHPPPAGAVDRSVGRP